MKSRFLTDQRGGVAVVFSLALVPMLCFIGAAVDYSRLASAKSHVQQALDAAALEAGRRTIANLDPTPAARNQHVRAVYDANLSSFTDLTTTNFSVSEANLVLTLDASGTVKLAFGGILGIDSVTVGAQAQVPVATPSLEVALVLDNTTSMGQYGKMSNLKLAAKNFLTTIDGARQSGAIQDAKIAIVPFTTQVKLPTSSKTATWLSLSPSGLPSISSSQWQGCVADRLQPYDADLTVPLPGSPVTLEPAVICQFSSMSATQALTSDFSTLSTAIDAMNPNGTTNTTIGLAWGLNVLTNGRPLGDNAAPVGTPRLTKAIIFLTDGTNTQDRFSQNQSAIDARMSALCTAAKTTPIQIYTVRVLDGNETLLRNCASSPGNYTSITDASQLDALFQAIAGQLTKLRLSS